MSENTNEVKRGAVEIVVALETGEPDKTTVATWIMHLMEKLKGVNAELRGKIDGLRTQLSQSNGILSDEVRGAYDTLVDAILSLEPDDGATAVEAQEIVEQRDAAVRLLYAMLYFEQQDSPAAVGLMASLHSRCSNDRRIEFVVFEDAILGKLNSQRAGLFYTKKRFYESVAGRCIEGVNITIKDIYAAILLFNGSNKILIDRQRVLGDDGYFARVIERLERVSVNTASEQQMRQAAYVALAESPWGASSRFLPLLLRCVKHLQSVGQQAVIDEMSAKFQGKHGNKLLDMLQGLKRRVASAGTVQDLKMLLDSIWAVFLLSKDKVDVQWLAASIYVNALAKYTPHLQRGSSEIIEQAQRFDQLNNYHATHYVTHVTGCLGDDGVDASEMLKRRSGGFVREDKRATGALIKDGDSILVRDGELLGTIFDKRRFGMQMGGELNDAFVQRIVLVFPNVLAADARLLQQMITQWKFGAEALFVLEEGTVKTIVEHHTKHGLAIGGDANRVTCIYDDTGLRLSVENFLINFMTLLQEWRCLEKISQLPEGLNTMQEQAHQIRMAFFTMLTDNLGTIKGVLASEDITADRLKAIHAYWYGFSSRNLPEVKGMLKQTNDILGFLPIADGQKAELKSGFEQAKSAYFVCFAGACVRYIAHRVAMQGKKAKLPKDVEAILTALARDASGEAIEHFLINSQKLCQECMGRYNLQQDAGTRKQAFDTLTRIVEVVSVFIQNLSPEQQRQHAHLLKELVGTMDQGARNIDFNKSRGWFAGEPNTKPLHQLLRPVKFITDKLQVGSSAPTQSSVFADNTLVDSTPLPKAAPPQSAQQPVPAKSVPSPQPAPAQPASAPQLVASPPPIPPRPGLTPQSASAAPGLTLPPASAAPPLTSQRLKQMVGGNVDTSANRNSLLASIRGANGKPEKKARKVEPKQDTQPEPSPSPVNSTLPGRAGDAVEQAQQARKTKLKRRAPTAPPKKQQQKQQQLSMQDELQKLLMARRNFVVPQGNGQSQKEPDSKDVFADSDSDAEESKPSKSVPTTQLK